MLFVKKMTRDVGLCCGGSCGTALIAERQSIPAILRPAPPWSGVAIVQSRLQNISLSDYRGKYLVLFFYPYDFTFSCPAEIIQFSERIDEFRNLDAEVVAASTDSEYSHFAWTSTPQKQGGLGEMRIPILADKSHQISKDYGVLDEKFGIAQRALFVIDHRQFLRHISINDIAVPRCVDETLRLIRACQFVDKYGDACPVGLKDEINANDAERDYFKTD